MSRFLIGTVLYSSVAGFFQIIVHGLPIPGRLRTDSAEHMEMGVVGLSVVVLAADFLGFLFAEDADVLLRYGAANALASAALALSAGLRTWPATLAHNVTNAQRVGS